MAITVGTPTVNVSTASRSSVSFSHDSGTASGRLLILFVITRQQISAVSYGGISFATQFIDNCFTSVVLGGQTYYRYLIMGPAKSGSNTVSITYLASTICDSVVAVTCSGADTDLHQSETGVSSLTFFGQLDTGMFINTNTATGTSVFLGTPITTTKANAVVMEFQMAHGISSGFSTSAGFTEIVDQSTGGGSGTDDFQIGVQYITKASPGSQSYSSTISSAPWVLMSLQIVPWTGTSVSTSNQSTDISLSVEAAFGASLPSFGFHGDSTWFELSPYVMSGATQRGKQRQADSPRTGTCSMVLRNEDRRFDPDYTSSPYSPNVSPNTPVRVRVMIDSYVYPIFAGFADSWDQSYDVASPRFSTCVLRVSDEFKILARRKSMGTAFLEQVRNDNPVHYWPCDDDSNATKARNLIVPGAPLIIGGGCAAGETPLTDWLGSSISVSAKITDQPKPVTGTYPPYSGSLYITDMVTSAISAPFSIEMWAAGRFDPLTYGSGVNYGNNDVTLWATSIAARVAGNQQGTSLIWSETGGTYRKQLISQDGAASGGIQTTDTSIGFWLHAQDQVHHYVVTFASGSVQPTIYIDGVNVGTFGLGSTTYGTISQMIFMNGFEVGAVSNIAVYNTQLSAATVLNHFNLGNAPYDRQTTNGQIYSLLGLLGVPFNTATSTRIHPNLTFTDWGGTENDPVSTDGNNALSYILNLATTDDGYLFITRGGSWRFVSRHERLIGLPTSRRQNIRGPVPNTFYNYSTSQATFGDGGGAEIPYTALSTERNDRIISNAIKVSRADDKNSVYLAEDSTSQDQNGYLDLSLEGNYSHNEDAVDAAKFILARSKDPRTVITGIEVQPALALTSAAAIYTCELQDRVTIVRRPQNVGSAISKDVYIYGIDHNWSNVTSTWKTKLWCGLAETTPTAWWQFDHATNGKFNTGRFAF